MNQNMNRLNYECVLDEEQINQGDFFSRISVRGPKFLIGRFSVTPAFAQQADMSRASTNLRV
jgi:hypothetical protein